MNKNSFYITTTLPYVNADPHIGFALELVQSDAIARYKRLMGADVFFSTGTDEHGQKVFEAAEKEGKNIQEYVDHFSGQFKKLENALSISNDVFVRTTDAHHKKAAQEMWRLCNQAGDIYKKAYEGKYCVGCESFKTDKDLNEVGQCLIHPHLQISVLKEENYFFRFSNYQEKLLKYLEQPEVITPEWRREEAINFVKGGLEDFSISREKERLSWGVPVPGDESQVMYVWFDALTNYISTLGWPEDEGGNFKKFWENGLAIQTAGKDQVRFQSIMWQAMLMSANIKNTDKVIYHGFITGEGGIKMSKSLGNVINPHEIVEEYGTDALRYFLLRDISPFEDSPFTKERFKESYNANLANGVGNLASRIMKMASTNLDSAPVIPGNTIPEDFKNAMEEFNVQKATNIIWHHIGELDAIIQREEPYKLVKVYKEKGTKVIEDLVVRLYTIGRMLNPIMPETSDKIKDLVKANKMPDAPLFLRKN